MTRPVSALCLAAGLFAALPAGSARAQGGIAEPPGATPRPFTPALTCQAVRSIVARQRHVVLASSPNAYETVHFESGACRNEVTSAPAFEPTLDDPSCFAGYRCVQRNNGENSVR